MEKNKALFLISSPLQLLFSQNAIKKFSIDESTYIFFKDSSDRYKQMENIALRYGLHYRYENGSVSLKEQLLGIFRKHSSKYNYLFIGNFFQSLELVYLPYLKSNGKVVYLDDGNNSIAVLNGSYDNKKVKIKRRLINFLYWSRNYSMNNFFTIYGDIPSKEFNVIQNVIEQNTNQSLRKEIYIVGTNIPLYCRVLGISTEDFVIRTEKFITDLKENCSEQIIYIPHGRDTSGIAPEICKKMGVIYLPLELNIEATMIINEILPTAIYGFGSTALYTLKHIYPKLPIYNVFYDSGSGCNYKEYVALNNYYTKTGINLIVK